MRQVFFENHALRSFQKTPNTKPAEIGTTCKKSNED
jgi:hypothetical protein